MANEVKDETRRDYAQRVLRTLVFLQGRLDEELSLEELAQVACFSPYHFHRVFKAFVGESVMEHVRRLRLERAALKLAHGNEAVTMLGFEARYENVESFSRAFAGHFGMSPMAYRQLARKSRVFPDGVFEEERAKRKRRVLELVEVPVVKVEDFPARVGVFMRHVGRYEDVGATWGRLFGFVQRKGLFSARSLVLGIAHDSPSITPEEKIRYDACVTVEAPVRGEGDVGVVELPASRRAVFRHRGSYSGLKESYDRLLRCWFPGSGYALANVPDYEIYQNHPGEVPESELVTDICLAVMPEFGGGNF